MKFLSVTLAALSIGSANAVGGALCRPILTTILSAFDAALPINVDPECTCSANADSFLDWLTLQFYFNVQCGATLCVDDLKDVPGFENVIDALPLATGSSVCVSPTGGAKINPLNKRESNACSGASQIILNVTKLEEMTGQQISDAETITTDIPDICFYLEHKATLTELKSCSATIGGTDCPCAVCAEGAGIQLNCPSLFTAFLPDALDSVADQTTKCISANMLSKGEIVSPFFAFYALAKPNPYLG